MIPRNYQDHRCLLAPGAGQDVFVGEILASGFKQVQEIDLLKDNYFLRFEKAARKEK